MSGRRQKGNIVVILINQGSISSSNNFKKSQTYFQPFSKLLIILILKKEFVDIPRIA
jgi:hypothetical protein